LIEELEALSLRAWPPSEARPLDGWVLCRGGITRRTNSVQAWRAGTLDLDDRIERCERFYRERGRPAVFKLTAASQPKELEARLQERGYALSSPTSVQTLSLAAAGARLAVDPEVGLAPEPGADWLAACFAGHGLAGAEGEALGGILRRVPQPRAFAALREGGTIAALGLGVRVEDRLMLCEVATASGQRRRGLARRLVGSLLAWGRDGGARRSWLQVVVENRPARALYAGFGFAEAYRYWYRARAA
jgi:ribosomal protein S18 acetylase RimI-like enzyme